MTLLANVIPAHTIGMFLLDFIDNILNKIGLAKDQTAETIIYIAIIVAFAIFMGWIIRKFVLFAVKKLVTFRHTDVGDELLKQKVFTKTSHIIPPLVFLALIPFAFETDKATLSLIVRIVGCYGLICLAIAINAILSFMWVHYDTHDNKNNHPLRGLLNTGHGIVWIVIAIIIISVLVDKSPGALLAGLGAFAAALMLIFKDSILGLVAGVQMSQNDMLRVGDWIVVPSTNANGTVMEVTLTMVKVQNWDNTTVYLPPYTLVSTYFQNYRSMFEVGAREIERAVYIDNTTIQPLSSDEADALVAKINNTELEDFVKRQRASLAAGKGYDISDAVAPVNGSLETNLGLFRAYLGIYLHQNPNINTEHYLIVRTLEQTSYGTPLQLYCYSRLTKWTAFEAVRSEVFEHVAAMAPVFGLKIYNAPFGNDFRLDGNIQPPVQPQKQ